MFEVKGTFSLQYTVHNWVSTNKKCTGNSEVQTASVERIDRWVRTLQIDGVGGMKAEKERREWDKA